MAEDPGQQWDWVRICHRCRVEAFRILRREHDVEEVVQEALARAWRSRRSCRTPEAPLAWCLQITRNEALRLIGRRNARGEAEPLDWHQELRDGRSSGEVAQADQRLDVERALQALAPADRLLVALRYQRDCSHDEIAAALDISEATARVRLHRVHQRLRGLL